MNKMNKNKKKNKNKKIIHCHYQIQTMNKQMMKLNKKHNN